MKPHIVQCRFCKEFFDTALVDYELVGKTSYYHKVCYQQKISTADSRLEKEKEKKEEALQKYGKKAHLVKCRICNQYFDANESDYMMPSKNYYYHKKCYESWQVEKDDVKNNTVQEDLWLDATWQYLNRDLFINPNFMVVKTQWDRLLNKKRTPKGIYFALRYFYEVKKGDKSKANGGIGIIDYIYEESVSYWAERELRGEKIVELIEQQVKERLNREKVEIKRIKPTRKKKTIKLNIVEEQDD